MPPFDDLSDYHRRLVRIFTAEEGPRWIGTFSDAAVRATADGYAITFGTASRVYPTADDAADAIQHGEHTGAGRPARFAWEKASEPGAALIVDGDAVADAKAVLYERVLALTGAGRETARQLLDDLLALAGDSLSGDARAALVAEILGRQPGTSGPRP